MTQKDVFFDRARACQLISSMLADIDSTIRIDLPPPAVFKVKHVRFFRKKISL